MRTLAAMVEYRLSLLLAIDLVLKCCGTLKFQHGKIVKCAISWKQLIVEWNGWKFGTHSLLYCIHSVLFISNSFISIWGHSVHFAKISNVKIFKRLLRSLSFHSISTKLYRKHLIGGNTGYYFSGDQPKLKIYGTLKISILSYISIINKAMLFASSGKRSSRASRSLVLLLSSLNR